MPRSLLLATFVLGLAALATPQGTKRQEELLALPRVCLAQEFIHQSLRQPVVPEAEREQWKQTMGPAYTSFHHFCWGLIDMRRASVADVATRNGHYSNAVLNFNYVLNNADDDFPMLPEVQLRMGMALRFLGEEIDAAKAFSEAIRVKSNYTPAYAALIDLYVDLNDLESAQLTLARGLERAPESKILLRKKEELGALEK